MRGDSEEWNGTIGWVLFPLLQMVTVFFFCVACDERVTNLLFIDRRSIDRAGNLVLELRSYHVGQESSFGGFSLFL